jgi:hypothetical protein
MLLSCNCVRLVCSYSFCAVASDVRSILAVTCGSRARGGAASHSREQIGALAGLKKNPIQANLGMCTAKSRRLSRRLSREPYWAMHLIAVAATANALHHIKGRLREVTRGPFGDLSSQKEEIIRLTVARAVWPGRCWLRARCRCAALLVPCQVLHLL